MDQDVSRYDVFILYCKYLRDMGPLHKTITFFRRKDLLFIQCRVIL